MSVRDRPQIRMTLMQAKSLNLRREIGLFCTMWFAALATSDFRNRLRLKILRLFSRLSAKEALNKAILAFSACGNRKVRFSIFFIFKRLTRSKMAAYPCAAGNAD